METATAAAIVQKKKPAAVRILGWLFILFSIMSILSGVGGMLAQLSIDKTKIAMQNDPKYFAMQKQGEEQRRQLLGKMDVLFTHFKVLAGVQVILAIFTLIVSIQFLRCREWARMVLEAFNWLAAVFTVCCGVFFAVVSQRMFSRFPSKEAGYFPVVFILMSVAMMVFYIGILGIVIKVLRSPTVRDAMIKG